MIEERRDNNIFVLGLLLAAALAFYGLWTEEHPVVVELVELVKNQVVKYLEPQTITRIDKQIVYLTATPRASVNELIYSTPVAVTGQQEEQAIAERAVTEAEKEAILRALTPVQRSWIGIPPAPEQEAVLRALTPVPPTFEPSPTWTLIPPPPPSTMPPMPATQVLATQVPPTQAPAPPTQAPLPPTQAPPPPTQAPPPPTQAPPPTQVPPTQVPPTQVPPTQVPPTQVPPTQVPPTQVAPTQVPPTQVPPTQVPPTQVPPTQVSQALKPITPVAQEEPELIGQQLIDQKTNPEQPPALSGMATLQGNISSEEELTLILTNGDYYSSFEVGSDGEFWFENVPNGSYNLSANPGGAGAQCGQITISVPEGHRVLTYNYIYYKHQCGFQR